MMTPVVYTVTVLDDMVSVNNVMQKILNISSLSIIQEIIQFNAVGMLNSKLMLS